MTQYDERDRPLTKQWVIPSAATGVSGTYTMKYTYDRADHVRSVQYPAGPNGASGETVSTSYDAVGNPTTLIGADTYVSASTYTTNSSLKAQTLGSNALSRSLTYEPDTLRLSTLKAGAGGSTTNRQNLTYTYDKIGNVKTITDGNNANQRECFNYDQRNQLLRGFTGTDDCSTMDNSRGANPAPYSQSFAYDSTGNLVTGPRGSYLYTTKPHAPTTVGSDTYSYNENGDQITRTVGGVTSSLSYDYLNRLSTVTSATSSSYIYGGDDQRLVRKDGTTVTLYLANGNYQVKSVNGGSPVATVYYTLEDQRVAVRKGANLYFQLPDQLGSTNVTTDASGNATTRQNYFPFGGVRPGPSNALPTDETYLGKTLDAATGLLQLGARYYDPGIGRFLSPDPLQQVGDPQTANPYTYSGNNPETYSDPDGTCFGFCMSLDIRLATLWYWCVSGGCAQRDAAQHHAVNAWRHRAQVTKARRIVQRRVTNYRKRVAHNLYTGDLTPDQKEYRDLNSTCQSNPANPGPCVAAQLIALGASPARALDAAAHCACDAGGTWSSAAGNFVFIDLPSGLLAGGLLKGVVGLAVSRLAAEESVEVAGEVVSEETLATAIKPGSAGGETAGKAFSRAVKRAALEENPSTCVYCRMETDTPEVDHVIPRSRGGNATLDNAQTTCSWCNRSKGPRDYPVNPPPDYEGPWPPPHWDLP